MKYGGKGNSLLVLKKNGISVPKTILFDLNQIQQFLIKNIDSYSSFISELSFWKTTEPTGTPEALARFTEKISQLNRPKRWHVLHQNLQSLGATMIVRSSMNLEDHDTASFAGCFDSFVLNNPSEQDVWHAVRNVIQSAFRQSSILRMLGEGFSLNQLQVGFLIQQWIRPTLSGVCFSRNPTCLWEKNGLVEWGTSGEAVVQGTSQANIARQFDPIPSALKPFWRQLWRCVEKIEPCLKGPIDLEWVWDGQKLWVVQVRLIATEEAQIIRNTPHNGRWTREHVLERFPEPLTPLGFTALEDFFESNLRVLDKNFGIVIKHSNHVMISYGGYIYANPDFFRFPNVRLRFSHYCSPWTRRFWKCFKVAINFLYEKITFNSHFAPKKPEII